MPTSLTRTSVVVDETVWHEIDLGVSAARELVGEFTIVYVEAKAGEHLLTSVAEMAQLMAAQSYLCWRT